jgi:hypothetical protein
MELPEAPQPTRFLVARTKGEFETTRFSLRFSALEKRKYSLDRVVVRIFHTKGSGSGLEDDDLVLRAF